MSTSRLTRYTELMRIDAHQHFWIYNPEDYVWMGPAHGPIRRDFLPEHLAPLLDSIGFDGSIAVQARQLVKETEWLLDLAEANPRIFGVVGWLDLCSEQIDAQIERFASRERLVGVRHVVHDEADPQFVLRNAFRHGISLLEPAGLAYDLLLRPQHIGPSIRLVDEFPNQPFVIDHIAKPLIAEGSLQPWEREIREIARRRNVTCKLSGMVTEADHDSWKPDQMVQYMDVVLEAFGPDRLMIGSDWPVCTLAGEYEPVMRVVLDYIGKLSASEREAVAGETCARFYGVSA